VVLETSNGLIMSPYLKKKTESIYLKQE